MRSLPLPFRVTYVSRPVVTHPAHRGKREPRCYSVRTTTLSLTAPAANSARVPRISVLAPSTTVILQEARRRAQSPQRR